MQPSRCEDRGDRMRHHIVFHCLAGDDVRQRPRKVGQSRRLVGRQVEFGHSAVEGGAAHAEKACGFGAVSTACPGRNESAAPSKS